MNSKLRLTGFQRNVVDHSLGVDYEYAEYEDRGALTPEQCQEAHDWLAIRCFLTGAEFEPITLKIPAEMIEAAIYVLDNAVNASTMLTVPEMHGEKLDAGMSIELIDAMLWRTQESLDSKSAALRGGE